MSDPRLTAARVSEYRRDDSIFDLPIEALINSHEAFRADVERLTAENARLKRTLANDPHEAAKKLVNLAKSFRTCDRCEQEIAENDETSPVILCGTCDGQFATLTAEHAALKESGNALFVRAGKLEAEHAALREECEQWREKAARDVGHLIDARVERDARDTLLAEARAEITRLTAENAALREEIARLNTSPVTAASVSTGDSLPQQIASTLGLMHSGPVVGDNGALLLTAERDALREELAVSQSSWATERELLMSKRRGWLALMRADLTERERELAEARAEIAKLKAERRAIVTIGDLLAIEALTGTPAPPAETKDCKPVEDWRGANEDGRKEKG